jgi:hypothetical protein
VFPLYEFACLGEKVVREKVMGRIILKGLNNIWGAIKSLN